MTDRARRLLRVGLIGCGAAGSTVLATLEAASLIEVAWIVDTGEARGWADHEILGELPVEPGAELILLGVPDDRLPVAAGSLATRWGNGLQGRLVAQLGAAGSLSQLNELAELGAHTGLLHPLMSFPRRWTAGDPLPQIPCWSLCGADAFRAPLRELLSGLEAQWVELSEEEQLPYHLACVFSANALPVLLGMACKLWPASSRDKALPMLEPILRQVVGNSVNHGPAAALSGPVARGDRRTVQAHLDWLREHEPGLVAAYLEFQGGALELREQRSNESSPNLIDWLNQTDNGTHHGSDRA